MTEHLCVAVDRDGRRYTEHTFSAEASDPWRGATILTRGIIRELERDDMLPLTETHIDCEPVTTEGAGA